MSDTPDPSPPSAIPRRFRLTLDARDVLGGAGLLVAVSGLAFVHLGLAAAVVGLGLFAVAAKLSR